MASVRLGRDTRRQIERAAVKAYDTAVVEPKLDNETIETVWRGIVEHPSHIAFSDFLTAHKTTFGHLTDFSFTMRKSNKVNLRYGTLRGQGAESEEFELPTERESWISRGYYHHDVHVAYLALTEVERLDVTEKIMDLAERRKQARTDRQNYERQVNALLESCNTLKQLLDAQPSMKEFVPDEMLRELHKKVTRESQARERREIAQVDGDLINRVVLTSKLVA